MGLAVDWLGDGVTDRQERCDSADAVLPMSGPTGPLKARAEAERLLAAELVRPRHAATAPAPSGLFHFAALLAPKSNVMLSLRGARQRSMAFPPGSLPSVAPITSHHRLL
jgi:hypothetical protein